MRRTLAKIVVIALFGVAMTVVAGCGGGGGGSGGGGGPTPTGITFGSNGHVVLPTGFDFFGGNVTVTNTISGVSSSQNVVYAIVQPPNGAPVTELMSTVDGTTYTGAYPAPMNYPATTAATYTVHLIVQNLGGTTLATSSNFQFQVPKPDIPQPPGV
jgi:hypothetical protein